MTKRDAPESGFDAANPSKRQVPDHHVSSHGNDPVDSIQPNPPANNTPSRAPSAKVGGHPAHINGSAAHRPTPNSTILEDQNDDLFIPEAGTADPENPDYRDDFIFNDRESNEIAKEASNLQLGPTSAVDDVSHSSVIPDQSIQPNDEESQGDDSGAEQPTLGASPRAKKRANKDRFKSKKKKRCFYNPLLWEDGAPDSEALYNSRKSDALICGTTNISIDTEPLLVTGTLWKNVLLDELPHLLKSTDSSPLPPQQEKDDFFKACLRLGRLIEPNHLSRLLGDKYRSPEYCAFLLQGFVGLINNNKVRRLLRGSTPEKPEESHRDVVVYGDQLYPSDDELITDHGAEASTAADGETTQQPQILDGAVIEESDREEDNNYRDPPHVQRSATHEIRHRSPEAQTFFAKASFVLRNYMRNVTGQDIKDVDDFAAYCNRVGITFLSNRQLQPHGRLKWLKERMSAPEIGKDRTVSEPLELWKHAVKTYSMKSLSRCAVIRVDHLLDWLGFVAHEAEIATSEEEYYRVKRPVVAIAPTPLLYLADKAVDCALRVLSMAAQTAEMNLLEEERNDTEFVIDDDDIRSAALCLVEDSSDRPHLYLNADMVCLGNRQSYNREWPALLQRPLTAFHNLELCNRTPQAVVSVPNSITEEMRAVLMSCRLYVRRKLYANANLFKEKDPLLYMSAAEKRESQSNRRTRNKAHGINWSKHINEAEEEEKAEDHLDAISTFPAKQSAVRTTPGQETPAEIAGNAEPRALTYQTTVGKKELHDGRDERTKPLPEFFDQVNFAELIAFQIGLDDLHKRKANASKGNPQDLDSEVWSNAALFLTKAALEQKYSTATICFHRLGWICLHALGITRNTGSDDNRTMGYASSANYTNFAQLRQKKPATLSTKALFALMQITDSVVRNEAEILMACAAHDDGRPWLDAADVALVASVRKEEFPYSEP